MKNIALFISFMTMGITLNSCSDHSVETVNNVPDKVILTIDGTEKIFTDVSVTESTYTNADQNIPTYNILATNGNDNGEFVAFQIGRDYTGTDGLYEFIYTTATGSKTISDNFSFNISQNSNNRLQGNFSGPLFDNAEAETPSATVTGGSFDIYL